MSNAGLWCLYAVMMKMGALGHGKGVGLEHGLALDGILQGYYLSCHVMMLPVDGIPLRASHRLQPYRCAIEIISRETKVEMCVLQWSGCGASESGSGSRLAAGQSSVRLNLETTIVEREPSR